MKNTKELTPSVITDTVTNAKDSSPAIPTVADYFTRLLKLELEHNRNRRPTMSITIETHPDDIRWAVRMQVENESLSVCCSPDPMSPMANDESCPYQHAINRVISILINSNFSHDAGFVSLLNDLLKARAYSNRAYIKPDNQLPLDLGA
jgi:hypothetical protein